MGGIRKEYGDTGGRGLTSDGIANFLRIEIMRADCVGPLRDGCGCNPRELGVTQKCHSLGSGSRI